jgi:cation diffusion facilitator family transporter
MQSQNENIRKVHEGESKITIIAAIVANILIGIVKFIAAGITGSAAMVSEGIHSIVDSGNGLLVLLGMKRSSKKADIDHPFGYGKELYFWTLVVAILIFSVGGGLAISHGYEALVEAKNGTHILGDPLISYAVLIVAMIVEGASLIIAIRHFNRSRKGTGMTVMEYIRESKDPTIYTVLLEDSAAEMGLVIAFMATYLGHVLHNPFFDGAASVMIGLVLIAVAAIIMRESMGLLVGEGMTSREVRRVENIVKADPDISECGMILTNYFGPYSLMMSIDVTFKEKRDLCEVIDAVDRIEMAIKEEFPQTTRIFIEAESLACVVRQRNAAESMLDEEENIGKNKDDTSE